MTVQHDVPSWRLYTTEAIEQYLDRVKQYLLVDPGWKVGPQVLAQLHDELRAREQGLR